MATERCDKGMKHWAVFGPPLRSHNASMQKIGNICYWKQSSNSQYTACTNSKAWGLEA